MFADTARIFIKSGNGGNGHVSFRRELYVPNGGPDGGDGGDGGDLIFEVDKGMNNLSSFRHNQKYCAENGSEGGGKRCHGKDGKDLVIKVPYGTVVREAESGQVIIDMSGDHLRETVLRGGRGGLGNMHFATPTMQAPKYAQPGKPGQELWVRLELKVIADVGLVGFPNVGKSTLITRSSNARPEIANYHFTTLSPHLGVVEMGYESYVMADIPGLIEGASDGAGLGHDFLRHIERCRVLVHVVDAAGTEGRDPLDDIEKINEELRRFNPELLKRPMVIAANKMDVWFDDGSVSPVERIREVYEPKGIKVFPISAATGKGVPELLKYLFELLNEIKTEPIVYEKEYDVDSLQFDELPINIYKESAHVYVVEGQRVEKMLGYTNLESEKGFNFFQNYMKEQKIIDRLKEMGLSEGDTVRVAGMEFEYYE
ncbi:MAG TPA: GTPase ObgE [Candidatus Avilachnospira avicola]|nr:GTPase ObgE [Candidatus Avilachnospira avicola]